MEQLNLYKILGVSQDAGINVIRKTYDKLVANPDTQKDTERFKAIGQAFEVLSHPGKHLAYDAAMQHEPQEAQDNDFNNIVVSRTENCNTGNDNAEVSMVSASSPEVKNYVFIAYITYALGLFIRFTPVVDVVLAYVKHDEAQGSIYASYIDWLIKAFWVPLIGMLFGMLTILILVSWLVLVAAGIWLIYRVVVGLVKLDEDKPIPTQGWF